MADSLFPPTGSEGHDANVIYALGSSPGESARLRRQADELAADSAVVLDRVGLRPGQAAIDLGCGPQGILDLLAERVAPAGRVVGLDTDPAHASMASEFAAVRSLSGVQIGSARELGVPLHDLQRTVGRHGVPAARPWVAARGAAASVAGVVRSRARGLDRRERAFPPQANSVRQRRHGEVHDGSGHAKQGDMRSRLGCRAAAETPRPRRSSFWAMDRFEWLTRPI